MIKSIDIYNDARRKLEPIDSIRYVIVEIIRNDFKLNFNAMAASLNRSANVISLSIGDLVSGSSPDKTIFINQQIDLASALLSKYIGRDVVDKFIVEETLTAAVKEAIRAVTRDRLFNYHYK
jgi:hypothetical protein